MVIYLYHRLEAKASIDAATIANTCLFVASDYLSEAEKVKMKVVNKSFLSKAEEAQMKAQIIAKTASFTELVDGYDRTYYVGRDFDYSEMDTNSLMYETRFFGLFRKRVGK